MESQAVFQAKSEANNFLLNCHPVEQRVVRRGHPVLGRLGVPVRVPDVALDNLVPPLPVHRGGSYGLQIPRLRPIQIFWISAPDTEPN